MLKNKYCWYYWLLIFILLGSGCSNELVILSPAPPVPNIVCILNPQDSLCYLTISKTALTDSNAADFINNNDKLRVDDAQVVLEAWGDGYKLWETSFSLMRSDSSEKYDSQVSRSTYVSNKTLRFNNLPAVDAFWSGPYDYFRLQVSSPQLDQIAYARIPIIKKPKLISPQTPMAWSFYGVNDPVLVVKVDLEEMKYSSLLCRFYFEEYTDHWEQKSIQFTIQKDLALIIDEQKWIHIRIYEEFFNKLAAVLPENTQVYARRFNHIILQLIVSDDYFHDYFTTYINALNQDMPGYTNISNAFGVFSLNRNLNFPQITFDPQTLDSLCFGRITKKLKFRKDL